MAGGAGEVDQASTSQEVIMVVNAPTSPAAFPNPSPDKSEQMPEFDGIMATRSFGQEQDRLLNIW